SSFDYDDALRLSDIKYANNVEGTFDYDAESRVVGFTYKTNNIAFIDHTIIRNEQGFKTHQLIDAGLIPLFPENQRKISTYNDVDQLTSEQIQTDLGWTDTDYTWNANGCLTKLSLDPILTNNNISLDYDYNNRLVGSTKNTDSAEYIYDASGARVARIFTDDTTSTTNFFIIDHTDSLKRPLAETDVSGNIIRYYIWNGFMLLAHIDIIESQNPTVTFYHQDELGNTLALTDSNGQVTDQFAYMPYGSTRHQPTALSTFSLHPSPFLWLGGYGVFYDKDIDIHLTVHRAYSADLRRFISPDPLGIDSFPNLYAYANMNPLAFIDPWGLCAEDGNWFTTTLDWTQGVLDGAGLVPAWGIFPDAANTLISVGRLNWGDAGLNAVAMVPILGQFSTAGKWGKRGLKYSDNAVDGVKYLSKKSGKSTLKQVAKEMKFKPTKQFPFDSHGQKVYKKGTRYISKDIDSHKGGVWKLVNKKGKRLGTYDLYLENKIGD
nr:toxin C-terminal domain-containing protein [Kiritimatiellia bacterium]